MKRTLLAVALCCAPFTAHAENPFSGAISINVSMSRSMVCTASQYGIGDGYHGKKTASGERFNTHAMTAAHKTLPFGSKVEVCNISNNRCTTVRINDRGPFVRGRCVDLSRAGANAIGMGGLARVTVERLK